MVRRSMLGVPNVSMSRQSLLSGGDKWWEGVRGSVRYIGDKLPRKLSELSLSSSSQEASAGGSSQPASKSIERRKKHRSVSGGKLPRTSRSSSEADHGGGVNSRQGAEDEEDRDERRSPTSCQPINDGMSKLPDPVKERLAASSESIFDDEEVTMMSSASKSAGNLYDPPLISAASSNEEAANGDGSGGHRYRAKSRGYGSSRLSLIFPKSCERLENAARSVKRDLVRLRSKSCGRLLVRYQQQQQQLMQKRSRTNNNNNGSLPEPKYGEGRPPAPVSRARATVPAHPIVANDINADLADSNRTYSQEYFEQNSTLRRSRRLAEEVKRRNRQEAIYLGPFISYARARVTCVPSPYDMEALKFRAGDIIRVIRKNPSGIWEGECNGLIGKFKFINVEEVERVESNSHGGERFNNSRNEQLGKDRLNQLLGTGHSNSRHRISSMGEKLPFRRLVSVAESNEEGETEVDGNEGNDDNNDYLWSLDDDSQDDVFLEGWAETEHGGQMLTHLLERLELTHLTSRLVLHGWDSLDCLARLTRTDLDYLGVEVRAEQDRLLSAVTRIADLRQKKADQRRLRLSQTLPTLDSGTDFVEREQFCQKQQRRNGIVVVQEFEPDGHQYSNDLHQHCTARGERNGLVVISDKHNEPVSARSSLRFINSDDDSSSCGLDTSKPASVVESEADSTLSGVDRPVSRMDSGYYDTGRDSDETDSVNNVDSIGAASVRCRCGGQQLPSDSRQHHQVGGCGLASCSSRRSDDVLSSSSTLSSSGSTASYSSEGSNISCDSFADLFRKPATGRAQRPSSATLNAVESVRHRQSCPASAGASTVPSMSSSAIAAKHPSSEGKDNAKQERRRSLDLNLDYPSKFAMTRSIFESSSTKRSSINNNIIAVTVNKSESQRSDNGNLQSSSSHLVNAKPMAAKVNPSQSIASCSGSAPPQHPGNGLPPKCGTVSSIRYRSRNASSNNVKMGLGSSCLVACAYERARPAILSCSSSTAVTSAVTSTTSLTDSLVLGVQQADNPDTSVDSELSIAEPTSLLNKSF